MIKQFINKLVSIIEAEQSSALETLSRTRGLSQERREALVEKNLTLIEVKRWISELHKLDADELDDDEPTDGPDPAAVSNGPAPRAPIRRRAAGRWEG